MKKALLIVRKQKYGLAKGEGGRGDKSNTYKSKRIDTCNKKRVEIKMHTGGNNI